MSITIDDRNVRLVNLEKAPKLKAFVDVNIADILVVRDIAIMQGKEGEYVKFPNKKTKDGKFSDVCLPKNPEAHRALSVAILSAYENAVERQKESSISESLKKGKEKAENPKEPKKEKKAKIKER